MLQLPNQVAIGSFGFSFSFKVPKIGGSVTTETSPKFGFSQKLATEFFSLYHYIFGSAINKSKPVFIMTCT